MLDNKILDLTVKTSNLKAAYLNNPNTHILLVIMMKKTLLSILLFVLLIPVALADYGYGMMDGGVGMMGGSGWFGMGLIGLIYLVIAAFVFSIIFWSTRNWFANNKSNDGHNNKKNKKR